MAHVLLVDDDDDIRDNTTLRLQMHGYDVTAVADAHAARTATAAHTFDVAILDIDLPDTDGITLLRQLRADKNTATLPVLVYTSHWSAAVAAEATPLADAYLTKSQSLARLVQTVGDLTTPGQPATAAPPRAG